MAGCGMAIPGEWLALQHKLRDVVTNAKNYNYFGNRFGAPLLTVHKVNVWKIARLMPYLLFLVHKHPRIQKTYHV